jgi:hypothetical protein
MHKRAQILVANLIVLFAFGAIPSARAELLSVDATAQAAAPETGLLKMGSSASPDGHTMGVNSQYLTRDGKPWLPVMGEFHYTRVPRPDWETEILKMKTAGVDIVSTYVIWMHHEEQPGKFLWSDDHDLRGFVELCAKHGLYVAVRPGPWVHSEVRFGGIPDWVVASVPTRSSDALYLKYVTRFWGEVAKQLAGLYFKDGGPIIGLQLENEYNLSGPNRGPDHIAKLKAIALSLGMDVPLYTTTAWDRAAYPPGEVLPVVSGYPDEPWGIDDKVFPPKETYYFRFGSRNAGGQTPTENGGTIAEDMAHTPFLGAEYAGGLPVMYRRRPVLSPDDIGAMLPTQLGSGANLYGYYMFHGGRNPKGLTNLEENTSIGGYNDLPQINYDFQAPFGENGEPHAVLGALRPIHYFLHEFGGALAPMMVHVPASVPQGKDDLTIPRWSVRSAGDSGFLFFNNHVRQHPMAAQKDVQFSVKLPSGALTFPSHSITVPPEAYFIWPINLDLAGARLTYATAQPITRFATDGGTVAVFAAQEGIPVEFAFEKATISSVKAFSGKVEKAGGAARMTVSNIKPGTSEALRITTANGTTLRVIVLSAGQARILSVGDIAGQRSLVLTSDDILFEPGGLKLRSEGNPNFKFAAFPAPAKSPIGSPRLHAAGKSGLFQKFESRARAKSIAVKLAKIREAEAVPALAIGGVAKAPLQPAPETFGKAAAWSLTIPPNALDGLNDATIEIDYAGDVGRLFAGTQLIDDHYYNGLVWRVGLKAFPDAMKAPLMLTVLPLRADAPIYIQAPYRPKISASGQISEVRRVRVVPRYELSVRMVN